MKWSFKLGRILGIDVYVHFTFLLLLGFIGLSQALAGGGRPTAANAMLFFLCIFGCVLLHEYGQASLMDDCNALERQLDTLKEQTARLKHCLARQPNQGGKLAGSPLDYSNDIPLEHELR